jgi:hypothetical protein
MTDPQFTDRLRAAIDASPYMQAAVDEAQRRTAGDAVQAVMGDDSVQGGAIQVDECSVDL